MENYGDFLFGTATLPVTEHLQAQVIFLFFVLQHLALLLGSKKQQNQQKR